MMTKKNILLLAGAAVFAAALAAGAVFGWNTLQRQKAAEEAGIWQAGSHWGEALKNNGSAASGKLFSEKLTAIKNEYFTESNKVYCAVIPDKGYYLQDKGAPKADYDALLNAIEGGFSGSGIQYIDLTGALSAEQYYFTDSHWKQETLQPVLDTLGAAMGFSADLSTLTPITVESFAGAYGKYGAAPADTLTYLTGPATQAAVVDNFQHPDMKAVYDTARLTTDVPYDVFLSGATPLITITSPHAKTDRELIIFRDSYTSSLAPLLLEEYRTITLVDIRYMVSTLLPQYVTFTNQDVLFLYSTLVADQSTMLH